MSTPASSRRHHLSGDNLGSGDGSASRSAQILAEAARLFAASGYQATSLNDLAAAAGLAKPTLFHYFDSKQEILFSLYRHTMELSLVRMEQVVEADAPTADIVRACIREHTLLILENRSLFKILFDEEGSLSEDQRAVILRQQRKYIQLIADRVNQLSIERDDDGEVSATIVVQAVLGMASWVYRWFDESGQMGLDELADAISTLAMRSVTCAEKP